MDSIKIGNLGTANGLGLTSTQASTTNEDLSVINQNAYSNQTNRVSQIRETTAQDGLLGKR